MAEALSDDDIISIYREEATNDDGNIINPVKKMRTFDLSHEKVKKSSLMANVLKRRLLRYNNFKWTCCKINHGKQGTKKYYKIFIESSSFQDNYENFNKEFVKKLLHNQQKC